MRGAQARKVQGVMPWRGKEQGFTFERTAQPQKSPFRRYLLELFGSTADEWLHDGLLIPDQRPFGQQDFLPTLEGGLV